MSPRPGRAICVVGSSAFHSGASQISAVAPYLTYPVDMFAGKGDPLRIRSAGDEFGFDAARDEVARAVELGAADRAGFVDRVSFYGDLFADLLLLSNRPVLVQ